MMFDAESGDFYCSDDNAPMRLLHERELKKVHINSYMFLYKRDGRE